jgi:hypothetical protein
MVFSWIAQALSSPLFGKLLTMFAPIRRADGDERARLFSRNPMSDDNRRRRDRVSNYLLGGENALVSRPRNPGENFG